MLYTVYIDLATGHISYELQDKLHERVQCALSILGNNLCACISLTAYCCYDCANTFNQTLGAHRQLSAAVTSQLVLASLPA
jgi:hypothetical protein